MRINRGLLACALGSIMAWPLATSAADLSAPRVPVMALPPAVSNDIIVTVTGNLEAGPRFPGSDRFTVFGYPSISFRRANEPIRFTAPDDGLSISFLENPSLRIGLVGRYRPGRYFGDDRKNLFGLRDVRWSAEPGAFVEFWPVDFLRARAEARFGVHGYHGVVGNVGLDFVQRYNRFTFSIGPRAAFGDTDFTSAYFSVTPIEAALNGRVTPFKAKGGVNSVGALASVSYIWSEQWATTVYGQYDRLVEDAGRSPISRNLGSRDQYTVGARLSYSFSLPPSTLSFLQ